MLTRSAEFHEEQTAREVEVADTYSASAHAGDRLRDRPHRGACTCPFSSWRDHRLSSQANAPVAAPPFSVADLAAARVAGRLLDALAELEPVAQCAKACRDLRFPLVGHAAHDAGADFDAVPSQPPCAGNASPCAMVRACWWWWQTPDSDLLDGSHACPSLCPGAGRRDDLTACSPAMRTRYVAVGLTDAGEALEEGETVEELSLKRISAAPARW